MNKENNKDCVFCRIVLGEIKNEIIYESANFIVIPDIKPATPGHCLILSKIHYKTILDLPTSLGIELIDTMKKQGLRLIKEGKADGFNLFQNNFKSAGQMVEHYHVHVIPRKPHDDYKPFQ